jgi:D-alanyl-D-alanine carboxypeptidase/D-alanyl-D-alanine-endopeptidase (penicillin-binding protein 4)
VTRMLRALLFGCGALCMVVFACAGNVGAQSRSRRAPTPQHDADTAKPAGRADITRFRRRVDEALSQAGAANGLWGILVTDAATGEILYDRNSADHFTPASNAKLFTTALALATLGPDYRVRTTIATSGVLDASGLLDGDLVLIGRGDANLSNRKFPYEKKVERDGPPEKILAELADAVAARGVKEISGDVVADDSLFQLERAPTGWTVDDILWPYGAAVSAIAVNDNVFTLDARPGALAGDPATTSLNPASDFYTIQNLIHTGPRGSEQKLSVVREPGSRLIRISGTMPEGGPARGLTIAIEEPAEYAANLLAQLLETRGIHVHGVARGLHAFDINDPAISPANHPAGNILAEHASLPLAEDIRLTNKNSENLHAELLLLLAAHEKAGATNYEQAEKYASEFFRTAGIADGDVALSDGSGLSRQDLVTPRAVVQLLRYAASQPWGELYRSSLPVAGEDGTLTDRMKNTSAAGRIFAKTGTFEHVNTLSGYATTLSGAHLTFSILGNNNNSPAQTVDGVLDAIAVAMVEELGPGANRRSKGCGGSTGC